LHSERVTSLLHVIMNNVELFNKISIPEFLPIIMRCTQRGDEALYYLLTDRMKSRLYSQYIKYKDILDEDFSEMLDSYYLYLHDYHPKRSALQQPYQLLLSVGEPSSFGAWLVNTFRYFLNSQAKASIMTLNNFDLSVLKDEQHAVTDSVAEWEMKYWYASKQIAYCIQISSPLQRLILIRKLLSILNKRMRIDTRLICAAMSITPISYRVMTHRLMSKLWSVHRRAESGEQLPLKKEYLTLTAEIYDHFHNIYPFLLDLYRRYLDDLPFAGNIGLILTIHENKAF